MTLRTHAWKFALAIGACAVGGYFALSGVAAHDAITEAVGMAAVLGILVGIRLQRPSDRTGWYLLALGVLGFVGGDCFESIHGLPVEAVDPHPTAATVFYLAGYLFTIAAAIRLSRNSNPSGRREGYADAAIITLGTLAISWHFLINSYVYDASLTSFGTLVVLAYPAMDLALIFIVFHSLLFRAVGRPFHKLIAGGLMLIVLTDFARAVLVLHAGGSAANLVDAGLLAAYVLLAAAALHPSVGEQIPEPPKQTPSIYRSETNGRGRIPVVAFAGFIPPTILLVMSSLGLVGQRAGHVRALHRRLRPHLPADDVAHRADHHPDQRDRSARPGPRGVASATRRPGGGSSSPGLPRRTHRTGQPGSAPRPGGACAGLHAPLGPVGGPLLRGSRRIQDGQRHPRPQRRRQRAGAGQQAALVDRAARRHRGPAGRRRIRRPDGRRGGSRRRRWTSPIASSRSSATPRTSRVTRSDCRSASAWPTPEPDKTTEQLLSEADSAMYEAKEKGKNCVEVFRTSMRARMLERLDLTNGFRWALGRSEFFLQYQPIVSLSDNRLQGFEALVRWSHPGLGEVEPLRFIPIAEETGFIVPLGRWVLVEACEQLAAWNAASREKLSLSVNLSRRQLVSPHLADEVRTALALSGIDPHQLILEITESVLMEDPDRASLALAELRDMGIRIAVDDFGTGYSSLSHLQRFPVDILKIDKSFIDPLVGAGSRELGAGDRHHRPGPEPRAGRHRRGHRAREPAPSTGRPRLPPGARVPDGPAPGHRRGRHRSSPS